MSVPAYFVVGDSLPFRADNVKSGRDAEPLPDATLTYSLLDADTRVEVVAGSMSIYDEPTASFEAAIAGDDLEAYDATTNPDGIVPNRDYLLRVRADNDGIVTTKTARLRAMLDAPQQE